MGAFTYETWRNMGTLPYSRIYILGRYRETKYLYRELHEFDLKTRDRNISSRLNPRFYFLCVWVCYSVLLQQ